MQYRQDSAVPRPPRPDRRPLLSVCTVLILSGFLVGISVAQQLTPDFRVLISITGLAGLVAFLGLDHASALRTLSRERDERVYMENRLVRHILSREIELTDHDELMELARSETSSMMLAEHVVAD